MEAIHNLDSPGEVFTGEVPDPVRPVAGHYPTCFAEDPLREVVLEAALSIAAAQVMEPLRSTFFVTPHGATLYLPCFCRAIGLFPPPRSGVPECRCRRRRGRGSTCFPFIPGDLATQGFCHPLNLFASCEPRTRGETLLRNSPSRQPVRSCE